MTVGRGTDCGLVVPDPEMALQHAIFEHRETGLFVRDLGAMGRVLVNRRETREARLKHGDIVELARTRLLVQAVVQSEVPVRLRLLREKRLARWLGLLTLAVVMLLGLLLAPRYLPKMRSVGKPPLPLITLMTSSPPPIVMVVTSAPPTNELRKMREELEVVREALRLAAARTAAPPVVVTVTSLPPRVVVAPANVTNPPPPRGLASMQAERMSAHPAVQLVATEQHRLPEQAQFDELRIVHITLQPLGSNPPPARAVMVKTDFFDEDQYTGLTTPTEALTPRAELQPEAWHGGAPIILTASYAVPAGLRDRQLGAGRRVRYLGFRVRVYVAGELQAQAVHPSWLLEGRP